MSLSEHEKTQFERLVAGLSFGDPVAMKEMERRERETDTGYIVFPKISARTCQLILSALKFLGVASVPFLLYFALTGQSIAVAMTGAIGFCAITVWSYFESEAMEMRTKKR